MIDQKLYKASRKLCANFSDMTHSVVHTWIMLR